jgi:hypothetical protein
VAAAAAPTLARPHLQSSLCARLRWDMREGNEIRQRERAICSSAGRNLSTKTREMVLQ